MTATAIQEPNRALRLSFQTRDVDEYRGILSAYHAPARAEPLSPTLFTVGGVAVVAGGVGLSRVVCPTGIGLAFDSVFDGYGLSLPAAGSFSLRVAGRGLLETRQGMGLIMDSSLVTHAVLGPGTNLSRTTVTTAKMHSRLAELIDQPILRRIRFTPDVSLSSPAARMAATLSRLIYEGMEGDAPLLKYPAALTSLREALLHLLLEGMPHSYSQQLSRQGHLPSPGHVKRAMDFMAANAAKPLCLSDIALAAGTSVRSLQGGFMRFRGVSPMAYLRNLRLHGVRVELLAGGAGSTVSHVAHTWGFANLSAFSTLYTRAFGERPSATLRRASRGMG